MIHRNVISVNSVMLARTKRIWKTREFTTYSGQVIHVLVKKVLKNTKNGDEDLSVFCALENQIERIFMINKKDEYVARLYDELFAPYPEFCQGVSWLGEEALASDAPDRFQQMWKIYLALMTKVGAEMFGSDVYWNTDSDQIEPVLDMLLNQGYSNKIIQLILGANNLLIQVKSDGYSYKTSKLREIVNQYYGIVRRYEDGGVLTIEDRMVKWDFIDHSNRLFGAAYDLVQDSSRPPKSAEVLRKEQEKNEKLQRSLEKSSMNCSARWSIPFVTKIKRFFRKIFSIRRS